MKRCCSFPASYNAAGRLAGVAVADCVVIKQHWFCLTFAEDEEVEQLLQEGEKTKRRLQKLQQRRDHYARLYYQALLELDATRLELSRAKQEIGDLRAQGQ